MRDCKGVIRHDDWETPNHYAKLVAELAEKQMVEFILDLLPDSCDKDCCDCSDGNFSKK